VSEIRIVRPHEQQSERSMDGLVRVTGVSVALAGAEAIHLSVSTMPAGSKLNAHVHLNCESALYVLKGTGYFMVGQALADEVRFGPGDFIYVPSGAPHEVANDGTGPVEFVVARNAAEEIAEEYTVSANATPL
jgi:uncharacterized RmlC-like cupin family protein